MTQRRSVFYLPFLLIFLVGVSNTQASKLYPLMDRHLVKEAEFIFVGTVIGIEYKSSSPRNRGEITLPHTFVTCSIEQVLKGSASERDTITLRMQGGPSESKSTRIMTVEEIPLFEKGDQGVFFVRKNDNVICPLVGWEQGFIRIQNERVFTYEGRELILNNDALNAARFHPLDFRNYRSLNRILSRPSRSLDTLVRSGLFTETLQILENPDDPELIRKFDSTKLTYEYLTEFLQDRIPLLKLIPTEVRILPGSKNQMLLFRDLSLLLTQRKYFPLDQLKEITLRTATNRLLNLDQEKIDIDQMMLLNRRILEDMYPTLITRSLDQTIIPGTLEESMVRKSHQIGDQIIQSNSVISKLDGPQTTESIPSGDIMTAKIYLTHVATMIQELHTADELKALPTVPSANIQESFYAKELAESAAPVR